MNILDDYGNNLESSNKNIVEKIKNANIKLTNSSEGESNEKTDTNIPYKSKLEGWKRIFFESQEFAICLVLSILPFLSISYVNLVNLIAGLFLVCYVLNVKYFWVFKFKKILLNGILYINIFENIVRIILFILFLKGYLDAENNIYWKNLNKYLLIHAENITVAIYHFSVSILITISLAICLICKRLNTHTTTDEYIYNIRTLQKMHRLKYFIVLSSYFILCMSASLHPNIIYLVFLVIIIFLLILWVVRNSDFRKKVHKVFGFILVVWLTIILLVQYIFNIYDMYKIFFQNKENLKIANMIGIIYVYDVDSTDQNKFIYPNLFSVLLLFFVLMNNSIYIKCRDYKMKVKNYKKDAANRLEIAKKKLINKKKMSVGPGNIKNTLMISSFGDENIILTINENDEMSLFTKLGIIIGNYIYSPYFIMHFCRIGIIIYINNFHTYVSILFIIWLLYSFTIDKIKNIYKFTAYIIFPLLIISALIRVFVNIEGIDALADLSDQTLLKEFGFDRNDNFTQAIFLKIIIMYLFGILIHIHKGEIEEEHIKKLAKTLLTENNKLESFNKFKTGKENNVNLKINDTTENTGNNEITIDKNPKAQLVPDNNLREPLMNINLNKKSVNTDATSVTHAVFGTVSSTATKINKPSNYAMKFSEIIIKLILTHIDKVTLFFMYVVAVKYVNIFHFILMVIFLIQLTLPQYIRNFSKVVIIIISFILLTEYLWIFISTKVTLTDKTTLILNLIFLQVDQNLVKLDYNDQYLWIALYCFYVEYQNYSSKVFELYNNKSIDLYIYLKFHLKNYQCILNTLNNVLYFFSELYIWILFSSFLASIVFLNTNLLLGIKLITFFIVIDQYLKIIESNFGTVTNVYKYLWLLIIVTGISSILLYIFQFWHLPILIGFYENISEYMPFIFINNLEWIGLNVYSETEIKLNFIPHFASNLISVMIYHEVGRIIRKKKLFTSITATNIERDLKRTSAAWKAFYQVMFFLLNYYWMVVFFAIFWLSINWRLSVSLGLLQIIFLYRLVKCYIDYFLAFSANSLRMKQLTNFNSMLRLYAEEKSIHFKLTHYYRTKTFKVIWVLVIIYVVFTYFISLAIDMDFNLNEIEDDNLNKNFIIYKGYISSISYVAGLYHSNNDRMHFTFFQSSYGYFLLMMILILEKFFQNKCSEYYTKLNSKAQVIPIKKRIMRTETVEKTRVDEDVIIERVDDGIETSDKFIINDINDLRNVDDPLSFGVKAKRRVTFNGELQEPSSSLPEKSDIRKNVKESKLKNLPDLEIHAPLENPAIEISFKDLMTPKTSSMYVRNKFGKYSIFNDDVCKDVKDFDFPNLFQRHVSGKSTATNRISTEVDLKTVNNIYKVNNEEVMIIDGDSSDDDITEDNLQNPSPKEKNGAINDVESLHEEEHKFRARRRKNASYKKKILIKYSLEFQTGVKKVLEEIILFMILLSAILKINILSFLNISIVFITYIGGNKLRSIFYLACTFLLLFISQYFLFTSNLSHDTDYIPNPQVLNDVSKYLYIPWYGNELGFKWGLFFSLGVSRYQINSLWIDFFILIMIYFYLEFFSFAIFETELSSSVSTKIAFAEYENSYKRLSNFKTAEYENFKKSMKISFDIDIQDLNNNSNNVINNKKSDLDMDNYNYLFPPKKAEHVEEIKVDNSLLFIYKTFKGYVYLTFHNITLIIVLIFSMLNEGLISIPYIFFSIIYIYKSHNFLVGNKFTFQHALKYFLKPFLFIDLFLQLLYQIPFEILIEHKNSFSKAMNILGFDVLMIYNTPDSPLKIDCFSLVLLKIITYLLISLQEIIYNSNDFKKFILKYHLKMKEKAFINGKLHAFIFNNSRIKLMNERLEERRNIEDILSKIELQLTKWNGKLHFTNAPIPQIHPKKSDNKNFNKKLIRRRNLSITRKDLFFNNNLKTKEMGEKKKMKRVEDISIKKLLKKYWLINLCINLHEQSTMFIGHDFNDEKNVNRILKGYSNVKSKLEEFIDQFEKENEDKYAIIQRLRRDKIKTSVRSIKEDNLKSDNDEILEEENEHDIDNDNDNDDNGFNKFEKKQSKIKKARSSDNNIIVPSLLNSPKSNFQKKNSAVSIDSTLSNYAENSNIQEIKNDQKEEFVESTEYYELKTSIRKEFFNHYCSRFKILQYIILNLLRYFIQNFEYICYLFMIINHTKYGCLLSLPWPLLVFCSGIISSPRPRKIFWKVSLIYCSFIIIFKFFLQISLWSIFFSQVKLDANSRYEFADKFRIGIQLYQTTFSKQFFNYIIYDFILISVLIAHQFMLIRKGLWDVIEPDLESIDQAYDRINKNNSRKKKVSQPQLNSLKDSFTPGRHSELNQDRIHAIVDEIIEKNHNLSLFDHFKRHYSEIFPTLRNEKPGRDFYVLYTIFQMTLIVFIIFFYTKMDQDTNVNTEDAIKTKQFSGNMVIFAFLHVFLIVLERYIYLKNSRTTNGITYKIYDLFSGRQIKLNDSRDSNCRATTEELEDIKIYQENDQFEVCYMQHEDKQYGLIYKYVLQLVVVIFSHIFIFWYFPITGNNNLNNSSVCESENLTCNDFSANMYLQMFYTLYCFYLFFSGLQIKYSMIDLRKQSALMKGDNIFYSSIFKAYKAIPFLYELKLLIDWTFTTTSLDLFKWLKFEAIFDLLYLTKCRMKTYYGRKLGEKVPGASKFFLGGIGFFSVLVIVFGPLILFSTLNPTNKANLAYGAKMEVILSMSSLNGWNGNVSWDYTLYKNEHIQTIGPIDDATWNATKFNVSLVTKNYPRVQVQKIKMKTLSQDIWEVSPPSMQFILGILKNPIGYKINLNLKYSFARNTTGTLSDYAIKQYSLYPPASNDAKSTQTALSDLTNGFDKCSNYTSLEEYNTTIELVQFYEPDIKLSSSAIPSLMTNDDSIKKTALLEVQCKASKIYLRLMLTNPKDSAIEDGIEFYTFSDLVSTTTSSYDVLTFYISFIIVIGKFLRTFISGEAEKIIYTEMPRPQKLLNLCEGIKISRYKNDLQREDQLYYVLIDLFRSPEMLKMITKPSLKSINSNFTNPIAENNSNVNNQPLDKGIVKKKSKIVFY